MEPVKIGFVGGGEHARMSLFPSLRHAFGGSPGGLPSLVASHAGERLPELGAELVAIAEHKLDHAERIASFHGGREIYQNHHEMLENADIDGVIVCLHPKTQADVAIDCLNAGKHVWVEKPHAETLTDSYRLQAAADDIYQANYRSGLRILDVSNPEAPVEVAFFDTVSNDRTGGGTWSNYPYFQSGTIVVTSSREGLFMLKKRQVDI